MRFGSLFSGIGGLDLGLERAGMTPAWQVERDPYCLRVLGRHWPDVPRYTDVREVDPHELPRIDVLAGGFPCQPHSFAGERKASDDDRDLWPEFARIIRATRPRWVLAENVVGLLSSEGGRFFGRVLRDLAELGFDAEWDVLPACALGAPHLRERVFLVAHANRLDGPARVGGFFDHQEPLPARGPDEGPGVWVDPPPVPRRVADGVPARVDRLRTLGNAVVPQVAEWIGRQILEADRRASA